VLILEAGGNDNWIWFHIPVGYLLRSAIPVPTGCSRPNRSQASRPRAGLSPRKVIGGSSAINAMISMRGQAADYDHWRQLGLTGWGYDDVLPRFLRLEDHFPGASEHHGVGGGWRIEAPRLSWEVLDAVGDAAAQMGIRRIADFNTGDNEGIKLFPRQPEARAALVFGAGLSQAGVEPSQFAAGKECAGRTASSSRTVRAVGVRFMQGNDVVEARTKGEVILCAGSIGSTQILHRSGIGPVDWLAPLGIDVTLDRQGVGRNLARPSATARDL